MTVATQIAVTLVDELKASAVAVNATEFMETTKSFLAAKSVELDTENDFDAYLGICKVSRGLAMMAKNKFGMCYGDTLLTFNEVID